MKENKERIKLGVLDVVSGTEKWMKFVRIENGKYVVYSQPFQRKGSKK